MKRTIVILTLLALVAMPLLASIPAPAGPIGRHNPYTVFANGKLYTMGGYTVVSYTDSLGKLYQTSGYFQGAWAGISIYDPGTDTWTSSKYDGTGPLGFDPDGNGKCDWTLNLKDIGMNGMANQCVAYDDDSDGVEEIFAVGGYFEPAGEIYRYDPNAGARGTWSLESSAPGLWGTGTYGTRRSAVGVVGTKLFIFGDGQAADQGGWYDFVAGTWNRTAGAPATNYSNGALLDGKLYYAGGTTSSSTGIWAMNCTDPPTWVNAGAPVGTLNIGVDYWPQVVGYNHKLYILGGHTGPVAGGTNAIQVFDPGTGLTTTSAATLPFSRWGFAAAVDQSTGKLYVGGGASDGTRYYAGNPADMWCDYWVCDLDDATPTFAAIASDPSYFPYEDWNQGNVTGTVTGPGGVPIPNAVVGIKTAPNAMADASLVDAGGNPTGVGQYQTADGNGNWTAQVAVGSSVYIAAWKEGWQATADTTLVVAGGTNVVPLSLTQLAGVDIAQGLPGTSYAASSAQPSPDPGGQPLLNQPVNAFDGVLRTGEWATTSGSTSESMLIDLDRGGMTNKAISGITQWMRLDAGAGDGYTVDLMTNGDPLSPFVWADPGAFGATVTNVYTGGPLSRRGYWIDNVVSGTTVDPIKLAPGATARGIRISYTSNRWPPYYELREIQVHSATDFGGLVMGKVRDFATGNPIYDAVVQIGGLTGKYMITDATGSYSFTAGSGTTTSLYADAPGYDKKIADSVFVSTGGTPTMYDILLTANAEPVLPNSSFETGGTTPDSWSMALMLDNGYTNALLQFPTHPDLLAMWNNTTRLTGSNTTPGGTACARVGTGTPAPLVPVPSLWDTLTPAGQWSPEGRPWMYLNFTTTVPIDPSLLYNFYVKAKAGSVNTPGNNGNIVINWCADMWGNPDFVLGNAQTNHVPTFGGDWEQISTTTGGVPMLHMAPPAGTTHAVIRLGLWSAGWGRTTAGELLFDDVVLDGTPTPTMSEAKNLPDGKSVAFSGDYVTASPGQGGVPANVFYVETGDRTVGIRVASATTPVPVNWRVVTLSGVMATVPGTGERYVDATAGTVTIDDNGSRGHAPIGPLVANTNAIQTDKKLRGELVRVAGTVRAVNANDFTIADGYTVATVEQQTKVIVGGTPSVSVGDFVTVNGVVSAETTTKNCILLRPAVVLPTPANTMTINFETTQGYALGSISGQPSGTALWSLTGAGAADVAASPTGAFGAQSLKFTGPATGWGNYVVLTPSPALPNPCSLVIIKTRVYFPVGSDAGLFWVDGSWTFQAWADSDFSSPIQPGANVPTGAAGTVHELIAYYDFANHLRSSWFDGQPCDINTGFSGGTPSLGLLDYMMELGSAGAEMYVDNIEIGWTE